MGTVVQEELVDIYEEDISASTGISAAFFKKVAAGFNYLKGNSCDFVGMTKTVALTEAQFAAIHNYDHNLDEPSKKWVLLKGQSIAGSDYARIYGVTVLPDMVNTGAHIEQLAPGGTMLGFFYSANKSHTHTVPIPANIDESGPAATLTYLGKDQTTRAVATQAQGEAKARPNSVTFNIFLKINN